MKQPAQDHHHSRGRRRRPRDWLLLGLAATVNSANTAAASLPLHRSCSTAFVFGQQQSAMMRQKQMMMMDRSSSQQAALGGGHRGGGMMIIESRSSSSSSRGPCPLYADRKGNTGERCLLQEVRAILLSTHSLFLF